MDSIKKYVIFDYLDMISALKCLDVDPIFNDEKIWKNKALQYDSKRRKNKSWILRCKDIAENKICNDCGIEVKGKSRIFFGIAMCKDCIKTTTKFKFIQNCNVYPKYMLDFSLYTHFPSCIIKHAKFYNEYDIIKLFCRKYNVQEDEINNKVIELKKEWERREKEKQRQELLVREAREKERSERRTKLVNELNKYDLQLRADSKLCHGFIDGNLNEGNWTVETIAVRMCEVRYLFNYCNMSHYLGEAFDTYRRPRYYSDDDSCDDSSGEYYDSKEIFYIAETKALKKKNGKYPNKWPWLV